MKLETIYDRLLLGLVALAAIVLAVFLIMKAGKFKGTFNPPVVPEVAPDPVDDGPVGIAIQNLGKEFKWAPPMINGATKPANLGVSTLMILRGDQIVDLTQANPQLRPPVPNKWLVDNQINYLREDCLEMDDDKDGFSNLEEYHAKTNPSPVVSVASQYPDKLAGKESRPPLLRKLGVTGRQEEPYVIEFTSEASGTFNLKEVEVPGDPRLQRGWVQIGDTWPKTTNRFKLLESSEGMFDTAAGQQKRIILIVQDTLWDEPVKLVQKVKTNIPFYFAEFRYFRYGSKNFSVRRGDSFLMSQYDEEFGDRSFKLHKIDENGAELIEQTDDGPVTHVIGRVPVEGEAAPDTGQPASPVPASAGAVADPAPGASGADVPAVPATPSEEALPLPTPDLGL